MLCERARQQFIAASSTNGTARLDVSIAPEALIDRSFFNVSRKALTTDGVLDFYLHTPGGAVTVGGGGLGAQTIQSIAISAEDQSFFRSMVNQLDDIISINFNEVFTASRADVDLYYDTEIMLDDSVNTLGLATTDGFAWELFVNYPEVQNNDNYRRYVLAHEFGHALGLEHPFDNSDGDTANGITDPWNSLFPEDTIMAYRNPQGGVWPEFFTNNDLRALISSWGAEKTLRTPEIKGNIDLDGLNQRLLTALDDDVSGTKFNDWINGSLGSDRISGSSGDDFLRGGKGDDLINGNTGDDWVQGDIGADLVRGGKGADVINGNSGDDRIYGDFGDDYLRGGKNNDWIDGGNGNDQIWGDFGADTIRISLGNDVIWGFAYDDGDRLEIRSGMSWTLSQSGGDLQINTELGNTTLVGANLNQFSDDWILSV